MRGGLGIWDWRDRSITRIFIGRWVLALLFSSSRSSKKFRWKPKLNKIKGASGIRGSSKLARRGQKVIQKKQRTREKASSESFSRFLSHWYSLFFKHEILEAFGGNESRAISTRRRREGLKKSTLSDHLFPSSPFLNPLFVSHRCQKNKEISYGNLWRRLERLLLIES